MADVNATRNFWNKNPLCASVIPYALGTREYFNFYDKLREKNEPIGFSYRLHEYKDFTGRRVLDLGCGNGYILSKYAREGASVFGMDFSETAVELSGRRFKMVGLKGNFCIGNIEDLPFETEAFDCVCVMGVLHHIPDIKKGISEIYRVLKKGGKLIGMVYHRDSALYKVRMRVNSFFTRKSIKQIVNEVDGVENPIGEVYSKNEISQLLNRFKGMRLFTGLLDGSHFTPGGRYLIPLAVLRVYQDSWGWFLYFKCTK